MKWAGIIGLIGIILSIAVIVWRKRNKSYTDTSILDAADERAEQIKETLKDAKNEIESSSDDELANRVQSILRRRASKD